TKRYAGSLGDPSRMAANFAGVVGGNDSRNDIVVRGNSPLGMLWQLEGLNIPNPNHFGALVSTGGPVSMLNNNNLDKSDFLTSAFPAQYGNAVAGIFDIKLRDGNNQKPEYVAQIGFNGFEAGAEGPFSKKSKASYAVNYRYSTLGVFQKLGIDFGTGSSTPLYQDLNFKISIPTKANNGKWTIFGVGGNSSIDLLGSDIKKEDLDSDDLYGDNNEDTRPRYHTAIAGVSYEQNISKKTFAKLTAGISTTKDEFTVDSLVRDSTAAVIGQYQRSVGNFNTVKGSLVFYTRTKFNARNSITSGFYLDATKFDLFNQDFYANVNKDSVRVNIQDNNQLYQGYSNWKHRFNTKFTLTLGIHAQYYSLNEQLVAEPRASFQYQINGRHGLSLGYGLNNQTQNIYTSYVQTKTPNGYILTNKGLNFTTSNHYVLSYDWNITEHMRLKAEAYFQHLVHVPVQQNPSSFSAINTGSSFGPDDTDYLVNNGTGTNQGVEFTLEHFFNKGYYFLITSSLFNSNYKGSDGIERNTAYNSKHVLNTLAGKEWQFRRAGNYLSLNLKVSWIGGRYLTPLDIEKSKLYGRAVFDKSEAYSVKQSDYFRTDFRVTYRKELRKSTLEFAVDFQNLTNHENVFSQSFNPKTNSIVTHYQQGFFPVPFARYTF
ncbi:MAG TPA: TonB-dependent receptor, partial [Cyclobacteriaceae bacterium]